MKEIFKDIPGYEGLYQVSNLGNVKSLRYNKSNRQVILKPKLTKTGYCRVGLHFRGVSKDFYIHRLVAEAFLPNPDNLPVVNHKDENKLNNNVENLEWCTYYYNNKYGTRVEKVTKKIECVETGEIFMGYKDIIDKMFDGKGYPSRISMCCTGKRKSAYGYHFKFVE